MFTLTSQLRLVEGFTTDAARLSKVLKSKAALPSQSVVMDTQGHSAQQGIEDELQNMAEGSTPPSPETIAALEQFETDLTATQLDLRVHLTMDALQQLARYLSAIEGRKNVIWFSGSFPISFDPDPDQPLPFLAVRNYEDEMRKTSELLTAARRGVSGGCARHDDAEYRRCRLFSKPGKDFGQQWWQDLDRARIEHGARL